MKMLSRILISAALAAMLGAPAFADKPLTEADVEGVVKRVLREHPELIVNSLDSYQSQQKAVATAKAAVAIRSMQGDLRKDTKSPSAGNPKGDVTIVEFFDYHCGYCKRFYSTLNQLLEEDKNVHVIFKEFPILSEDSETASRAALAVNSIDKSKYFAFHSALMKASGSFTMEFLTEAAKEAGIDEEQFKQAMKSHDIQAELDETKKLAQQLDVNGTPAIIVGTQMMPGAVPLSELKAKVAMVRQANKEQN